MALTRQFRSPQADAPKLYAAGLTRRASKLAAELEQLVPEPLRAGYVVSRGGEITLFIAGEWSPLPQLFAQTPDLTVQQVVWSRAEIQEASMTRFELLPAELCDGILADWFDPAVNALRVEVAPWWEGTAAQVAKYLHIPVETTVFHGVDVVPIHVIEAPGHRA